MKEASFAPPLSDTLQEINDAAKLGSVCVLASGDPNFFGIAQLLSKKLPEFELEVIPSLSSLQAASAKIPCSWQDMAIESFHGRNMNGFVNRLQNLNKAFCLTDQINSPKAIAQRLLEFGETEWDLWVFEELHGPSERVRKFSVEELAKGHSFHKLNCIILLRQQKQQKRLTQHSDEEQFAKRTPLEGLITKKEVRALSIMNLNIQEGDVVWDIGAGSGSVGIEAAKIAKRGQVFAIESNPESVSHCLLNRLRHKVDNYAVIQATAPDGLEDLPAPNGVFVGGSKGNMAEILDLAYERLRAEGRLVVNTITLESLSQFQDWAKKRNLSFSGQQIAIQRINAFAKGKFHRYEALNPIHSLVIEK